MSSNINFEVVQQENKTFAVIRHDGTESVVLGQYKSKSYAMKKLNQFSELEVSSDEAQEKSEENRIVFRNGKLSVFRAEICAKQQNVDVNQLQDIVKELEGLLNDYLQLTNPIDAVVKTIRSNIEFFQVMLLAQSSSDILSQLLQADSAANDKAQAGDSCAISADLPPSSNTGGLETEEQQGTETKALPNFLQDTHEEIENFQVSETYQHFVMERGMVKQVMLRRGLKTPAFIDTLSFTINEQSFCYFEKKEVVDFENHGRVVEEKRFVDGVEALAQAIAEFLEIMGLKHCGQSNGRNGYETALLIGNVEQNRNYGFIAYGGHQQKGSVMFHLTGEGLVMARDGWEKKLYQWLKKHERLARITRVDISHDMLWGGYTLDEAVRDWANDCYTVRQTRPHGERQGVDWLSGTKKGRTFYIGSKKSSRILYFYEKGKQLGDEDSEWVRVELRQRNKDYIIPLDVLLYAGDYLCSAYPYLSKVLNYDFSEQYAFERVKKTNGIALDHVLKYAKMQVSPAIQMLKNLGFDEQEIVEKLFNEKAKLPKRLVLKSSGNE